MTRLVYRFGVGPDQVGGLFSEEINKTISIGKTIEWISLNYQSAPIRTPFTSVGIGSKLLLCKQFCGRIQFVPRTRQRTDTKFLLSAFMLP